MMVERETPNAKSGNTRPAIGRVQAPPARGPLSPFRFPLSRPAFTLVELLITIAILAILAALILGVGAVAGEVARRHQTESTIAQIHTLLMDHYDSYRNRRVTIDNTLNLTGQQTAAFRLMALREILKTEIPDRWSDIALEDIPTDGLDNRNTNINNAQPVYLADRTALANLFWRRYQTIAGSLEGLDTPDPDVNNNGVNNSTEALLTNQSAECLFMVVMLATGDGEAPSLFGERVIGDTDGDGAQEFLDGWGNPIEFIRWAPGFDSSAQLSQPRITRVFQEAENESTGAGPAAANEIIAAERDPFDLFRIDSFVADRESNAIILDMSNQPARSFRLLPLIYSLGGDEESGISTGPANLHRVRNLTLSSLGGTTLNNVSDPFSNQDGGFLGTFSDRDFAADNITNHLITPN